MDERLSEEATGALERGDANGTVAAGSGADSVAGAILANALMNALSLALINNSANR